MRVLLFASTGLPRQGGIEYKNHGLANALVDLGVDTMVLSPYLPDRSGVMRQLPRRYRQRHYWLPPTRGLLDAAIAGLYLRFLKWRFDFDILAASVAYPCGYWSIRARRHLRAPVVVITEAADAQERPDLGGVYGTPRFKRSVHEALKSADAVTALCEATAVACVQRGAERGRVRVIPNGVDLDGVRRAGPQRQAHPYVLTIGRPNYVKGIDLLLRAFQSAGKEFSDWRLMIVGVPNDGEHRRLAEDLGIADRVAFAGTVVGEEKNSLLRGCELFVLPSRSEAFPLSIVEAMAAGKPIVACGVGCVPEIVVDGHNGLVVRANDVTALAEAMVQILGAPELRAAMGKRSGEMAWQYSWATVADRYARLFRELVSC
ncbi:MAG: glycosyltransferase family 4 protein [Actinobacteria bacterium]|nr:glycosyltransferase family 4 protein [Actinomycetota bacterium]